MSLLAPDSVTVTTADITVRRGERVFRHRLAGASLAAPIQFPMDGDEQSGRQAIYVRAIAEGAAGRLVLRGSLIGAPALPVRVALRPDCDGAACETPTARSGAAMVYEPQTRSVLLHGGAGVGGVPLADLWAWNGLHWKRIETASGPQARSGHVMASDPQSGQVLVGFGQSEREVLDDTWLLNPQTRSWQQLPTQSPGARRQAALGTTMVGEQRRLVLFGGQTAMGEVLGDTWLWDGADWQAGPSSPCESKPLVPSRLPRCRMGAALVESRESGTLLIGGLLGSQPGNGPGFDDVIWRFSDGNWSLAPLPSPAFVLARSGLATALLLRNGKPQHVWVGLGDSTVGLRQDSYVLDEGAAQFRPILGDAPSPRRHAAVAFDAEREELLIFGGDGEGGPLSDTLALAAETGYQALR